jgi:uncharacterized protein YndB with AHSA1/START domain
MENDMADLTHLVHIDTPAAVVFKAITEQEGLAGWWTEETAAEDFIGGVYSFRFGDRYYNEMRVIERDPNSKVVWECIEGDRQWIGTRIVFDLEDGGEKTILRFTHADWKTAGDFFAQCNYNWGLYMNSLKNYCETGSGDPFRQTRDARNS